MSVSVQQADFDPHQEYQALINHNSQDGAVVTFIGLVRDFNQGQQIKGLFIEHYPEMTEKSLQNIVEQAKQRWPVGRVRVIHRVGQLGLSEQIVYVGVTAPHRQAAFSAAAFIMDYLKTQAPFWKKETSHTGEHWVQAKQDDHDAANAW